MNKNELKTLKKIKSHALGSMYRMNAKTADCYAFDFIKNGLDWVGGWDWSRMLVDSEAKYILMLDGGEIKQIN